METCSSNVAFPAAVAIQPEAITKEVEPLPLLTQVDQTRLLPVNLQPQPDLVMRRP